MKLTDKAEAALLLGSEIARYRLDCFAGRYTAARNIMSERVKELELVDIDLPEEHSEFQKQQADLLLNIWEQLGEQRSKLGADGYAFPFFGLSYALYVTTAAVAAGDEFSSDSFNLLRSALDDINIHAEDQGIESLIRSEIQKSNVENEEGSDLFSEIKVHRIWARLTHQIMERWIATERRTGEDLPSVGLSDEPLYNCFISYSHLDEDFCAHLCESLQLDGVDVWLAPNKLSAGQNLTKAIEEALEKSDKLILVLTSNSIKSDWVKNEIKTAMNVGSFRSMDVLIPVYLGREEELKDWELIDETSGNDLAKEIRDHLYADFTNWEDPGSFRSNYELVKRALRKL